MMRKSSKQTPVLEQPTRNEKLYIVTDPIAGNINGKVIKAVRGDKIHLTEDAAKIFKDSILEI